VCAKIHGFRGIGALAARGLDQVLWDAAREMGAALEFPVGRGWEGFHTVSPGAKG